MRSLKRLLALSGLTGMLAGLAFAVPAQAGFKGACVTTGTAKVTPPVQLISGTGSYTFTDLQFVCVGAEDGTKPLNPGIFTLHINSQGTYTNIVCGTGAITSTKNAVTSFATTTTINSPHNNTLAQWQAMADNLSYTSKFGDFTGVLKWTNPQKGLPTIPKVLIPGSDGSAGGFIELTPDPTKGPPPNPPPTGMDCAKSFQAEVAFQVDVN